MPRSKKRRKKKGPPRGGVHAILRLDPAVLQLLQKLRGVLNAKLKETGRQELFLSDVIALVVSDAVIANAGDIQEESGALGLHRLAVQLAPLFGADGLAASGLPNVPDGAGARRFRPARIAWH
jgi:hypothetical protein